MATEIDPNIRLLSGKVLILADVVAGQPICTGIVERAGGGVPFLIKDIPPSSPPLTDPPTPHGPSIGSAHAHVAFKLNGAQEVKIDGADYFLVDESDVLGILPTPYEERLF